MEDCWKSFESEGVRYRVSLADMPGSVIVEACSSRPSGVREIKRYVSATVTSDGMSRFHGYERIDRHDQTGESFTIRESMFLGSSSYEGLRAAFSLGVEEAQRRLRTGAR